MSRLVHLCTNEACRHPKASHGLRDAGTKPCACCRRDPHDVTFDTEPVILETYALATHKPEPLFEPGTVRNPGGSHREPLCDCPACVAAYARETA
jgi:hypothetical protein